MASLCTYWSMFVNTETWTRRSLVSHYGSEELGVHEIAVPVPAIHIDSGLHQLLTTM